MNIQPDCRGCGTPYLESTAVYPLERQPDAWLCSECQAEQAEVHQFVPDANRINNPNRESMTNGEYAERAAIAVCDYSGVCNPEKHNVTDLIADLGHFADREGFNFRAIIRRAIRCWKEER